MTGSDPKADAAASFEPLRPRLIRVAYRMLGSMADAEDMVQEAFLRWIKTDRASVRVAEAFLRRIVTRLCLDQLKSAAHRREAYVGPWLPEPVVDFEEEQADDITLPLMLALERLSPLERAAFLLHDVFGAEFDEVADTIGRDAAACRQLASRARAHIRESRPRFPVAKERGLEIAAGFFAASRTGDLQGLRGDARRRRLHAERRRRKRPPARWPFTGNREGVAGPKGPGADGPQGNAQLRPLRA